MRLYKPFLSFIDKLKVIQLFYIVLLLTLIFAIIYWILSISSINNGLVLPDNPEKTNPNFLDCLYFSIITETTVGYGDIRPVGLSRLLVSLQAILGLVLAGIFVSKITSTQDQKLRQVANLACGYWIEIFTNLEGEQKIAFVSISYGNNILNYNGQTFNKNGEKDGRFISQSVSCEDNELKFNYINLDTTTDFSNGVAELTFESPYNNPDASWNTYRAVAYGHGKIAKIEYIGFKASNKEIDIFKSENKNGIRNWITDNIKHKQFTFPKV